MFKPPFNISIALKLYDIDCQAMATNWLINDSRRIQQGDVFCAIIGHALDGREYINSAIANGAALVLSQCKQAAQHGTVDYQASENGKVAVVQFFELDKALLEFSLAYYQQPEKAQTLVGITGTNGKTSTAILTANLAEKLAKRSAIIGTLGAGLVDSLAPIDNTTPAACDIATYLTKFAAEQTMLTAMEVSSHALVQKRVVAELFDVCVFTNLSRDHLDYHETMEAYAEAKFALFKANKAQSKIVNGDDAVGQSWLTRKELKDAVVFGLEIDTSKYERYVKADKVTYSNHGVSFSLVTNMGSVDIKAPLIGAFNVSNLLAALAVLISQNVALNELVVACRDLSAVTGRMELFAGEGLATTVVDYAHTPDGLLNAIEACKQHCQGNVWVIFGCGGDRDTGKRAMMGEIAEQHADHLVITNDNPRTEAPELIARDILAGCKNTEKIAIILDREKAFLTAVKHAKSDDIVLMAGKGHEDYIVIGDEKLPYDERAIVKKYYQEASL